MRVGFKTCPQLVVGPTLGHELAPLLVEILIVYHEHALLR
jgi:hypothetical protein